MPGLINVINQDQLINRPKISRLVQLIQLILRNFIEF